MPIENIPEIYLTEDKEPDLLVYDFKMTNDVVKTKVNLSMNMFSFLQIGKKQIHFADTSVAVNKQQSLIIKKGNSLWTELLDVEDIYFCKLLFFSEKKLVNFLNTHSPTSPKTNKDAPFFIIKNDTYINSYLQSLSSLSQNSLNNKSRLLSVKFEEIMLYLLDKYGDSFNQFLHSLVSKKTSTFKQIIEKNVYSNLQLEEIAFLCNMSLSTFKRHFQVEYLATPGKWFQDKRLLKAKELLERKEARPTEIFYDFGYNNLSNFSIAFKNKFGVNPTDI